MKKFSRKILSVLFAAMMALPVFFVAACGEEKKPDDGGDPTGGEPAKVDYVKALHLDMESNTKKLEVTIKNNGLIDGDTTYFDPPADARSQFKGGYIKARYCAVNTPESTGKIEKWGKTASNYTNDKLKNAASIIVESDDDKWNHDTNDRYMLWIWYKPQGETEYRNLNIELLQEGYGRGSKIDGCRYEEIALKALMQAQDNKLIVWSKKNDPNYFGGEGDAIDLKYLRFHIESYKQKPVRVEGVVTAKFDHSAYIEEYDEETDAYFGIAVYYHYSGGKLLDILSVGNRVSVHGTVTEFFGTYQISDVEFNEVYQNLNTNTFWLNEGTKYDPVFRETDVNDLITSGARPVTATFQETAEGEEEPKDVTRTLQYGNAVLDTAVTLKNLTITDLYSTKDGNGERTGQISITCQDENGKEIVLRTEPLKKEDGRTLYTQEEIAELGANGIASVRGIVDIFDGEYQLAIWNISCLTFA